MGKETTDKNAAEPVASAGLTPERAAQISTENQGRSSKPARTASTQPTDAWIMLGSFGGMPVADFQFTQYNGNQIDDCSKAKCVVNGKQYAHSTDIPGNRPKPLLHADGKPVLGPDRQPIVGPERVDLEQIVKDVAAHRNLLSVPNALFNFRHNGDWDFQRMMTDDIPGVGARPIFTQQYQNFANVSIGYILGSLGMSLDQIGGYANAYCSLRCGYDEPMSKQFPYLAERQVRDFEIGLKLYKERHPDSKK